MHGLAGKNIDSSGMLTELASNGYIVFALNSLDESCQYTE